MKATVHVTLKSGIADPQGRAIQQSLTTLGFGTVQDVRVGKILEIDLGELEQTHAEAQLKTMCEKLLANTVIEEYRYKVDA